MRRIVHALLFAVLVALLHLTPPAAPAIADEPTETCTLNPAGLTCPPTYAIPELLNPGALAAATPEQAASLRRLSEQAIDNTLADHQLPESDRAAVTSWGRADAQAELYALIVGAIKKSESERTADELQAVLWMVKLVRDHARVAAAQAGEEYSFWAGLDLATYRSLIRNNATWEELNTFLSGHVEPYNDPDTTKATTGYCKYRSPAPYETDYNGWTAATCSAPCPSTLGCDPPTPTYDEFVKWGQAAASTKRLQTVEYVVAADDIATAITFSAAVASAAVIGAVIGASGSLSIMGTIAASTFIFTAFDYSLGVAAGAATASGGGVAAAAIGGTVAVVILAVVIAVLKGIEVGNAATLPGKLAALVLEARAPTGDLASLLATTEGATTIFSVFVGATLPLPRNNETCDNSLIPPTAYTNGLGSTMVYLPLGDGVREYQLSTRPCLNPPDIPPAAGTDPHFVVRNPATNTFTDSPTIQVANSANETTTTVRVHGSWFIAKEQQQGSAAEYQYQSMRLKLTDWDDNSWRVWLIKDTNGRYLFMGVDADTTSAVDPDTCTDQGLCWTSRRIAYVDPDGTELEASVEPFLPPVGTPAVHLTPSSGPLVEASPVNFRANGFAPANAAFPVTYQWRFQRDGCGIPCTTLVSGGGSGGGAATGPSYGDPVAGDPVAHTWQTSGTYQVQVTATDRNGQEAVAEFPVRVATVPPVLRLESVEAIAEPGIPVTLRGTVDHAGQLDNERVTINWGDGTPPETVGAGPNIINFPGQPLRLESFSSTRYNLTATHPYANNGTYFGTVSVVDQGGATDVELFRYTVGRTPQVIDFPTIPTQTYGSTVTMTATGGGSGNPVTYIAGPASVCTPSGTNGATIKLTGSGDCEVGANQAGNAAFTPAAQVVRTFHVDPAPLTIRAQSFAISYGDDNPEFLPVFSGLRNGDRAGPISDAVGLRITGPAEHSPVGSYPIDVSGGTTSNYVITYVDGKLTIGARILTITADDKAKIYGAEDPVFTARFDGLLPGDTPAAITGLHFQGASPGAGVGQHPIVPSGATGPNYDIRYVNGTETITPAPLRITADDQTKVYGGDDPAFTASYDGLVNGDTKAAITGLDLAGAPSGSDVGSYPIAASGATNPNYEITFTAGTERITRAPLRITADDQTKVYGADDPAFTASYDGLVNGDTKAAITGLDLAGAPSGSDVGSYPIAASGATNPNYEITFTAGTERITRAPLRITADDQTKVYGADDPAFTASYDGLVNGDTKADIAGLVLTGAPTDVGAGLYLIQPTGATNPNYDITYVNGTERVNQAPLKVTADDKTKVYGAPDPAFTAKIDGLVNGDTTASIAGLEVDGAPAGSDVGTYPIVPSGATNPNYEITFADGTETITPAPLTIKADDKTAKYGTVATYTWTGTGWVNGDGDTTIDTAPTCKATVQGAAASVTTAPGAYAGAIACAGAADSNYTIGYASGKLTVNPVIRLSQTGLPTTVPQRATIDGQSLTLPTGEVEVGYGTAHSYSFPAVVVDGNGVAYLTTTPAFTGAVAANITVTASYATMTNVLASEVASGGLDQRTATTLTSLWNEVQAGLKAGNVNRTIGALRNFADQVRSQSGKKIKKPTADALLAHAQSVYTSIGATGTV